MGKKLLRTKEAIEKIPISLIRLGLIVLGAVSWIWAILKGKSKKGKFCFFGVNPNIKIF